MEFCVFSHYSDTYIINSIRFTARELDILSTLTSGHGMKAIAALLHISPKTVESHIRNIMLKLQCTSKEQILKFIEQSEFHQQLIEHYRNLYAQNYLDNILQQISRQNQSSSKTCIIICHLDPQNTQKCCRLVEALQKAGIKVILKRQLIHTWDIDSNFVIIESEKNLDLIHSIPKEIQCFTVVLATSSLNINTNCQLIQHKNYYDTVIKILEILYPDKMKKISLNTNNFSTISMQLKPLEQATLSQHKNWFHKFLLIGIGTCFLIGCLVLIFSAYNISSIPSNIPAFNEAYLLHRHSSIKKIALLLNKQTGIQCVALIGPGGSGKTTLARQYAQKQKSKVIYEINAETKIVQMESLKSLSYMLANTQKLREELSYIQTIPNSVEREKQQLQFIQSRLKAMKSWCLIFDNVEQFQDIRAIFPSDVRNWGKGKVILTTRNKQIQTVEEITPAKSLIMEELNLKAEYILFNQIFYEQAHPQISIEKDQEIQTFLQQLPPFPLDISTAAHYIKITQISFDEYLAKLKQIDLHFDTLQHQILKENTHYDQTRYQIISTIFEKLLRNHPEFKKLLFLICMVDSQNILKEFLYQLASNRNEADQFILQLRQHSLITEKQENVSIHRSIQKIALSYIKTILLPSEQENIIKELVTMLIKNIDNLYKINSEIILCYFSHIEAVLKKLSSKKFIKHIIDLNVSLGHLQDHLNFDNKLTYKYYKRALHLNEQYQCLDARTLSTILLQLASINLDNHTIDYCLQGIKLSQLTYDYDLLTLCYRALAQAFEINGDFSKSLYYYNRAMKEAEKIKHAGKGAEIFLYFAMFGTYLYHYINKKDVFYGLKFCQKVFQLTKEYKTKAEKNRNQLFSILTLIYEMELYAILDQDEELTRLEQKSNNLINEYKSNGGATFLLEACNNIQKGYLLIKAHKIKKAENLLRTTYQMCVSIGDPSPIIRCQNCLIRALIQLNQLKQAYSYCQLNQLPLTDKRNYMLLQSYTIYYYAAIIKYRQKDWILSLNHFADFFKNMKIFCKIFLDPKQYENLLAQHAFDLIKDPADIETCLDHSLLIFTAIYGPNHSFVKDFVEKKGKLDSWFSLLIRNIIPLAWIKN